MQFNLSVGKFNGLPLYPSMNTFSPLSEKSGSISHLINNKEITLVENEHLTITFDPEGELIVENNTSDPQVLWFKDPYFFRSTPNVMIEVGVISGIESLSSPQAKNYYERMHSFFSNKKLEEYDSPTADCEKVVINARKMWWTGIEITIAPDSMTILSTMSFYFNKPLSSIPFLLNTTMDMGNPKNQLSFGGCSMMYHNYSQPLIKEKGYPYSNFAGQTLIDGENVYVAPEAASNLWKKITQ